MRYSKRIHSIVPIFVGGTGRSGTMIVGDLLGMHPQIRTSTPIEIKFLANRSGLVDVVFGHKDAVLKSANKISILNFRTYRKRKIKEKETLKEILAEFNGQIWSKWWDIDAHPPHGRGLKSGISRERLVKILGSLQKELRINRIWAARRFMKRFIALQDDAGSESYWVETTPLNISQAEKLYRIFPEAFFINMLRDPRDVIASLLTKNWGPTTPLEGLEWIEKRLIDGDRSLAHVPSSQQITIALEDLAIRKREQSYQSLLGFLKLTDSQQMHEFFDQRVTAKAATSGRWMNEISSVDFNSSYARLEARLIAQEIKYK
ncbi:MAG: sulfotransferase [Actinomycetota bacterium]|nr:sulfotransferase [Actinomycetota bacterium]